jgi:hypothetical protein
VSTNGLIKELNESTKQMAGVLDVIGGIAEQTNLLALNAAIEAARAGEQVAALPLSPMKYAHSHRKPRNPPARSMPLSHACRTPRTTR